MKQKKIPFIGSSFGTETRNIINDIIRVLNDLGHTYNESQRMAQVILRRARAASDENAAIKEILDQIILESGTSDAEVVQARGSYNVLANRLSHYDDELARFDAEMDKTRGELDNLGTTTFTRGEDHTLVSIETPASNIDINYDSAGNIETIEEHRDRNNIRTTVNRDDEGVIQSYDREEF